MYMVGNTSDAEVPKVFSTSYGEGEFSVSMAYMTRVNAEFQKAAARGISLLFATGDYGVSSQGKCPNDRFVGQWPAAANWVTGVGGTEGGDVSTPEHVWNGSAGGFSDVWPRLDIQKPFVDMYFKTISSSLLPDAKYYNQTGAGFPDVSAQGIGFAVLDHGQVISVGGTSCSCPTFSGIVSLLNDIRLAKGKSTLGLLNPLFYKNPSVFNDITQGANQAGTGCGPKGFSATKGWDPVTGLGSPNFVKLSALVSSLP
jgi:tripeptidyl-peptidase I